MNATTEQFREEDGWLIDASNNRASIAHWGGRDKAAASLATLKNCRRCINCSDCSDCSGCINCSDCSDCSYCSDCSGCSYCSGCSDCSYCSDCSDCSDCSYCSYCSDLRRAEKQKGAKGPQGLVIPIVPNLHQMVFAAASQPEALGMGNWHTCETTHCRAGWMVTVAGEDGKALEAKTSTAFAAMQIAKASGLPISPPRFYEKADVALADMKRMADLEAARNAAASA